MNVPKTNLQENFIEETNKIKAVLINLEFLIKFCVDDKQVKDLQNSLQCARKLIMDLDKIVEELDPDVFVNESFEVQEPYKMQCRPKRRVVVTSAEEH